MMLTTRKDRLTLRSALLAGALGAALSSPAFAINITPSSDATAMANTLFLNTPSFFVQNATYSGEFGQAGTYQNPQGTYGLPSPGIVLSTGNVSDYGTGSNELSDTTTDWGVAATPEQESLLGPITGQESHNDVSQLNIQFFNNSANNVATFFATFGSEEFDEFVGSSFIDGFGLFVNGTNVAGVVPTGGTPPGLPVNIDHPDMQFIGGTELNGVLAPNLNPVLQFDVPINTGLNEFEIIIADASDGTLDTTVYLSSFFAEVTSAGDSEFNPVLPSNPPDPVTGTFTIELPAVDPDDVIWIDPPIAIGYEYVAPAGNLFDEVVAPSLATVADLDGYIISDGVTSVALAAGATLDLIAAFGSALASFTLTGIDEALMLDPANPLAFPLGVSFVNPVFQGEVVLMTPITDGGVTVPVPVPATVILVLLGLLPLVRRRSARV